MKKYKLGYTQGVFDMFHVGHLRLINHAKEYCDRLIVGVNSDALVKEYKHKDTVIKENERAEIVRNIKAVDECMIVNVLDKVELYRELGFDAVFIGDDWYGNPRWMQTKNDLAKNGVDVIFLPHTDGVSSTQIRIQAEERIV